MLILCEAVPGLFRCIQEQADNLRVELPAGLTPDRFASHGECRGPAIRAVRGYRIERIRHRKNARTEGNLVASEAPRISATVIALVMGKDNVRRLSQKWYPLHEIESDLSMLPHHSPLLRIQRTGFEQNGVGDP